VSRPGLSSFKQVVIHFLVSKLSVILPPPIVLPRFSKNIGKITLWGRYPLTTNVRMQMVCTFIGTHNSHYAEPSMLLVGGCLRWPGDCSWSRLTAMLCLEDCWECCSLIDAHCYQSTCGGGIPTTRHMISLLGEQYALKVCSLVRCLGLPFIHHLLEVRWPSFEHSFSTTLRYLFFHPHAHAHRRVRN
jgi:hypothetical protein